jgi:hypothetical protein
VTLAVEMLTWKDGAATVQSAVSTVAIVVGAVWVYFKFIKVRIYRPRLETSISARVLRIAEASFLLVSLSMKNVGSGKAQLRQVGTGLMLQTLDTGASVAPLRKLKWHEGHVLPVFTEHAWLESSEVVGDELLLCMPVPGVQLVRAELRLICPRRFARNIEFRTTEIRTFAWQSLNTMRTVKSRGGGSV